MAKVIGIDDEQVKRTSCTECAARVEYTQGEVKRRDGTDYSGGPDGEEYIPCPQCGERIVLRSW